jgi:hypothetical protein
MERVRRSQTRTNQGVRTELMAPIDSSTLIFFERLGLVKMLPHNRSRVYMFTVRKGPVSESSSYFESCVMLGLYAYNNEFEAKSDDAEQ